MTRSRLALLTTLTLTSACIERGDVLGPAEQPPTTIASDIAVADAHACGIRNGALTCWGHNHRGQLGLGDTTDRTRPSPIPLDANWHSVMTGIDSTCALTQDGAVWCWGANNRGQLAQGDRTARNTPTRVTLPTRASQIAGHFEHHCALLIDARLYCWGANFEGQLAQNDPFPGDNNMTAADALAPVVIEGQWRAVSTGDGHTCGIKLDGTLWCWGRNTDHQVSPSDNIQIREPIQQGTGSNWLQVAVGVGHSCALTTDQTLYCWGSNFDGGPLGIPGAETVSEPTRVGDRADFVRVAANCFHTCALTSGGALYCWGRGVEGQLGLGDNKERAAPTLVKESGVSAVGVGRFGTCIALSGGELACAGKNDFGELGTGDMERRGVFTGIGE